MAQNHDNTDWDNMVWDEETGDFIPAGGIPQDDDDTEETIETKDSNGNVLANGDQVVLTKDLDVKGSPLKLKRGTKVKVKLGDDPELIECKIGRTEIFLKTCFLKKV